MGYIKFYRDENRNSIHFKTNDVYKYIEKTEVAKGDGSILFKYDILPGITLHGTTYPSLAVWSNYVKEITIEEALSEVEIF